MDTKKFAATVTNGDKSIEMWAQDYYKLKLATRN